MRAIGAKFIIIASVMGSIGGLLRPALRNSAAYRSVGSSLLGFNELRTLVCQIAAVNNSRPLVPLSENSEDFDRLTPKHFIIAGPLIVSDDQTLPK